MKVPFSEARAHFTELADQVRLMEFFEDQEDVKALQERIHEKARLVNDFWKEIDA